MSQLERTTKAELIKRIRVLESQLANGCDADRIAAGTPQHTDGANDQPAREPQDALSHYTNLYDFAPIAYMTLYRDGRIAEINMTGAGMLGWERSWLLGQPFDRWILRDDLDRFSEHLRDVHAAAGKVIHELTIKGRQGRPMEVRLESVATPKSAPMTCQTAMIDITEHRRAEQEIRLLQAQLAHVARCNTMGELASSVAHELNQPLGAIVLYCDTCLRMTHAGIEEQDNLGEALAQVSDAARHASAIIRRLRTFLRKGDGQRTEVDLNTLIREVVKLIEMETRDRGGTIHLNLVPDLPRVIADPIQIEQVLVNLARNAIEAMDNTDTPVRRLTISTARPAHDKIQVTVRDTGPGMGARHGDRIFEPFYTTKANGMGMGLSISRSIVEAHDGRVWGEPVSGPGATFHFSLPVTKGDPCRA